MPILKLNQKAVDAAKAVDGKRTIYSFGDTAPGLRLDVLPSGVASWRVAVSSGKGRNGRTQHMLTIGPARDITLGRAVDEASKHRERGKLGEIGKQQTFGELFDRYHAFAAAHLKTGTHEEYRKLYDRHIAAQIGHRQAHEIKRSDVSAALHEIAKDSTPGQANHCQSVISAALSWMLDQGHIETHPALRLKKQTKANPRNRAFTPDELKAIWHAADKLDERHCRTIRLLALTGQRLNEIAGAAKAEIDDAAATLTIDADRRKGWRKGKPRIPHVVPLAAEAHGIVRAALKDAGGSAYLFPHRNVGPDRQMSKDAVSSRFAALLRDLKIADGKLHDIRHTVKTGMMRLGVPKHIADKVQDHKDSTIGGWYDHHDYLAEKRAALEAWERELLRIVGTP